MTTDPTPNKGALQLFGDTVHLHRSRLRLTQETLAALSGLSRAHIGKIENGSSNVTLETILRLATALQVEPTRLLEPFNSRSDLYPCATFSTPS